MMILDGVECRPVVGACNYLVGRDGSVWSQLVNGRSRIKIGPWKRKRCSLCRGYLVVGIKWDDSGKHTNRAVHILVLEAFVCPRPAGMEACHNDGNPGNPRLENLRWDTPSANNRDKIEHGTLLFGSKVGTAKLSEEQVEQMIADYSRGGISMKDLGAKYGIRAPAICRIITGQRRARTSPPKQMLTAFGETKSIEDWCDDSRCLVYPGLVRSRIAKGLNPEQAITRPPERHRKKTSVA